MQVKWPYVTPAELQPVAKQREVTRSESGESGISFKREYLSGVCYAGCRLEGGTFHRKSLPRWSKFRLWRALSLYLEVEGFLSGGCSSCPDGETEHVYNSAVVKEQSNTIAGINVGDVLFCKPQIVFLCFMLRSNFSAAVLWTLGLCSGQVWAEINTQKKHYFGFLMAGFVATNTVGNDISLKASSGFTLTNVGTSSWTVVSGLTAIGCYTTTRSTRIQ